MTEQEIALIAPFLASHLATFRPCFLQRRTAAHFDTYCRALLSDLPRKNVESIALASGTAVRTLQEFLITASWDHERVRATLQRHVACVLQSLPEDPLGTVGVVSETSCVKQGDRTPGVQRQHLDCVGKVANGIVTVHVGVASGRFQALLDADLYLPQAWCLDRERRHAAGIPDGAHYRPRWRIALDQLQRLRQNGVRLDWVALDEGYAGIMVVPLLLSAAGQRFVGQVPGSFAVRTEDAGELRRADMALTVEDARRGQRNLVSHQAPTSIAWRTARVPVRLGQRDYSLVAAVNEVTGEVRYFVTNATADPVQRVLEVALQREKIEGSFRRGKSTVGLTHYEGRRFIGLTRHLILGLVALGYIAVHTHRLQGEDSQARRHR